MSHRYHGHRALSFTATDMTELVELRARQRTFHGAYTRTALGNLGYALAILRLFDHRFYGIGLLFAVLGASLYILAFLRARHSRHDFADFHKPESRDPGYSGGRDLRQWGSLRIRSREIIKTKGQEHARVFGRPFITAGWIVVAVAAVVAVVEIALLVLGDLAKQGDTILVALNAANTPTPFDPGFNITAVAATAKSLPSHVWEFGTAIEALLELDTPAYSVFGPSPFPVPALDPASVPALAYAQAKIVLGTGAFALDNGDGAAGDPASLGVGATMLGKTNQTFADAAAGEIEYLLANVPRWVNGAISHRADVAELWADFMYMAPPFIAFYGADSGNATLLETAYVQCGLQREVLLYLSNSSEPSPAGTSSSGGRWEHIVGPQSADPGHWSTGNGWAAAGMTRVLATILKAPVAQTAPWQAQAISDLTSWIKEILDGAIASPFDLTQGGSGLLRNYLDDISGDGHGFGEISGSSLLASVAYRMAVLAPETFGSDSEYIAFAEGIRKTLGGDDDSGAPHITANGTATPAVNPLGWQDTTPYTAGSPEGNNFVVLLYSAWRDCVYAGVCSQ
ncbi:hypothetical protein HMN09_00202400 [Mycena chlorophos]|uniref:Glycoside hydrolase family 105 protein n=2 Tax=Mycena chlorophos TaxID=658473 RepID=A0A8H6TNP9_MYCCL|nr:hypothetical protein HMN09_00202400 [Mycena chlorophos]